MNKRIFMLSIGLGLLIWTLSPMLAGHREPWDAQGPYYMVSLFIAGLVPALIEPKRFWVWPIGVYLGQVLFIIGASFLLPYAGANLAAAGIVIMVFYMVPTVIGAAIGAGIRTVAARVTTRTKGK
mgnify:CR=1 FL=1